MVITFVTSIPALFLYGPVLNHANYITGAGANAHGVVALGALLEMLLIIWELSFGIYLIVKGFLPSPILNAPTPQTIGVLPS